VKGDRGTRPELAKITSKPGHVYEAPLHIQHLAKIIEEEGRSTKHALNFNTSGNPLLAVVGKNITEYLVGIDHMEYDIVVMNKLYQDPMKAWHRLHPRQIIIFEQDEPVDYYHPIPVPIVLVNCREQFQFDSIYCPFRPLAAFLALEIFKHYQEHNPLEIRVEVEEDNV